MRRSFYALAIVSIAAAPWQGAAAQSADPGLSYTYLEADYASVDVDVVDDDQSVLEDFDDGDGYALRGSIAFTPMFFGFAGYSVTDSDATFRDDSQVLLSSSQDVKRLDVGLGMNYPISVLGNSDFVVRAAYLDVDIDDFDFGATDDPDLSDLDNDRSDGYYVDAGMRSQLSNRTEASLGVRYTDLDRSDEFSVIGNLMFELTPNWGLNFEMDAGDDVGYYLVGARYSFGSF